MEQACKNDNIGYAQDKRNTSATEAQKVDYKLSKITNPCDADCSSLVRLVVNCAYYAYDKTLPLDFSATFYTGNMISVLVKTGKFTAYYDQKYTKTDAYLKRGDILVASGSHTVVALKDGISATTE